MSEEEKLEENPTINANAQSTIETNTLSNHNNTNTSKNKTKKKKPSEIQMDSQNSFKETKNKFKNTYSSNTLT